MATNNNFKNISNRVVTQLQNIDGGSDYNNTINHDYIKKGFKTVDQTNNYPSIWVANIGYDESRPERRSDFECPISVEVFGYVNHETDALEKAEDLASDMEKVIYADETLNNQVTELTIELGCMALDEFGVVVMVIRCIIDYSID